MVFCFMSVNVFCLSSFAFSFCLCVGVVTDMGVDECYEMWVSFMCRMIFSSELVSALCKILYAILEAGVP